MLKSFLPALPTTKQDHRFGFTDLASPKVFHIFALSHLILLGVLASFYWLFLTSPLP